MEEGPFTVRTAQEDDELTIHQLIRRAKLNPFRLDWGRFVVAEDADGKVIGCGQVRRHRGRVFELASIVVDEAWQHAGVASAMIERLLEQFPRPIWLMCNSPLIPFYEKFDFYVITANDYMPAYFRRIRLWVNLFYKLTGKKHYLAVMLIT